MATDWGRFVNSANAQAPSPATSTGPANVTELTYHLLNRGYFPYEEINPRVPITRDMLDLKCMQAKEFIQQWKAEGKAGTPMQGSTLYVIQQTAALKRVATHTHLVLRQSTQKHLSPARGFHARATVTLVTQEAMDVWIALVGTNGPKLYDVAMLVGWHNAPLEEVLKLNGASSGIMLNNVKASAVHGDMLKSSNSPTTNVAMDVPSIPVGSRHPYRPLSTRDDDDGMQLRDEDEALQAQAQLAQAAGEDGNKGGKGRHASAGKRSNNDMHSSSQEQSPIGSKKKGQVKGKEVDKEEGKKAQRALLVPKTPKGKNTTVAEDKVKEEDEDDDEDYEIADEPHGQLCNKNMKHPESKWPVADIAAVGAVILALRKTCDPLPQCVTYKAVDTIMQRVKETQEPYSQPEEVEKQVRAVAADQLRSILSSKGIAQARDVPESMVMSCIEGVISKKLYKFQAVLHELQQDVEMAVESQTCVGQQQEPTAQGVEEGPQEGMEARGAQEGRDKGMEEEVVDQGIDAVEDAQAQAHAVYMASLAMHQDGEDQF
ncbi:hypothetical protein V8C86DRAFT_2444685 [Haematococcus lacustris]